MERVKTTFQLRRDTKENWENYNPILGFGEPGYEIDTKVLKIGDGITSWKDLETFGNGTIVTPDGESIKNYVDEQIPIIKTGNDMFVQKINNTSNFYKEYNEFEDKVYSEFEFDFDYELIGDFKLVINYTTEYMGLDTDLYLYDKDNNPIYSNNLNSGYGLDLYGPEETIWYNLPNKKKLSKIVFVERGSQEQMELLRLNKIIIQAKGSYVSENGVHGGAIGRYNVIDAEDSYAIGYSNKIYGEKSSATGYGNTISGDNSFASGRNNIVSGTRSFVTNTDNNVGGYANSVFGKGNELLGNQNAIFGYNNKILSSNINNSFVSGGSSTITNNSPNNKDINSIHLLGSGLKMTNISENKRRGGECIVGRYNEDTSGSGNIFTVGGGYYDTENEIIYRTNAFSIRQLSNDADNFFRMRLGDTEITSEELNKIKNNEFEKVSINTIEAYPGSEYLFIDNSIDTGAGTITTNRITTALGINIQSNGTITFGEYSIDKNDFGIICEMIQEYRNNY